MNKTNFLFYPYTYTTWIFKFWEAFERKFPKLKQLVVSNLLRYKERFRKLK